MNQQKIAAPVDLFGVGWMLSAQGHSLPQAESIGFNTKAGWEAHQAYLLKLELSPDEQAVQHMQDAAWIDGISGGEDQN